MDLITQVCQPLCIEMFYMNGILYRFQEQFGYITAFQGLVTMCVNFFTSFIYSRKILRVKV